MRSDLDHLPERQQRELERVRAILLEEFDHAIARATQPHKRGGKVYKIVLFGSYARADWVDEPENGYQSDFDLLVVVSHEDLTDIASTKTHAAIGCVLTATRWKARESPLLLCGSCARGC